jgi:hypothetical protein
MSAFADCKGWERAGEVTIGAAEANPPRPPPAPLCQRGERTGAGAGYGAE